MTKNSFFNYATERFYKNFLVYECNENLEDEAIECVKDFAFGFSNENMGGVYQHALSKVNNLKSIACVGSSGDQVLNGVFYGAENITSIDANPMTEPIIELKKAAILNLNYQEFINYWKPEWILNPYVYKKISHDLNPYAQNFWDNIFMEMGNSSREIIRNVFHDCSFGFGARDCKQGSSFYRKEEDYNFLKQQLNNVKINYITADLKDFCDCLHSKYDLIMLSNIFDYVPKSDFFKVVKSLKEEKLNNGGAIQIGYLFCNDQNNFINVCKSYIKAKNVNSAKMLDVDSIDSGRVYENINIDYLYTKEM